MLIQEALIWIGTLRGNQIWGPKKPPLGFCGRTGWDGSWWGRAGLSYLNEVGWVGSSSLSGAAKLQLFSKAFPGRSLKKSELKEAGSHSLPRVSFTHLLLLFTSIFSMKGVCVCVNIQYIKCEILWKRQGVSGGNCRPSCRIFWEALEGAKGGRRALGLGQPGSMPYMTQGPWENLGPSVSSWFPSQGCY